MKRLVNTENENISALPIKSAVEKVSQSTSIKHLQHFLHSELRGLIQNEEKTASNVHRNKKNTEKYK